MPVAVCARAGGHRIVFRRADLDNFEIEAHVRNVARVSYATSLMKQSVLISTTEHLLGGAVFLRDRQCLRGIRRAGVADSRWLSQPFIDLLARGRDAPACAGSAATFALCKPLEFADGDRRIGIYPAGEFRVHCFVDYHHPAIGPAGNRDDRRSRIVQPRTGARAHLWLREGFRALQEMGLIRGGSLANAIVLDDTLLLNGPLRFPDEFGRHKALDLIGDLALVGRPLQARIVAHKAGPRPAYATGHAASGRSLALDRNHRGHRIRRSSRAPFLFPHRYFLGVILLAHVPQINTVPFDC